MMNIEVLEALLIKPNSVSQLSGTVDNMKDIVINAVKQAAAAQTKFLKAEADKQNAEHSILMLRQQHPNLDKKTESEIKKLLDKQKSAERICSRTKALGLKLLERAQDKIKNMVEDMTETITSLFKSSKEELLGIAPKEEWISLGDRLDKAKGQIPSKESVKRANKDSPQFIDLEYAMIDGVTSVISKLQRIVKKAI